MKTLPAHTLTLCDSTGAPFGALRFAPSEDNPLKGDCIFDITPNSTEQDALSEVRWLYKRRYKRTGEHRFKATAEGVITVTQASFKVTLDPNEDGEYAVRAPAPPVSGFWQPEDQ